MQINDLEEYTCLLREGKGMTEWRDGWYWTDGNDVEDLVLVAVDVQGRRLAIGHPVLDHAEAVGPLAGRHADRDARVSEPQMRGIARFDGYGTIRIHRRCLSCENGGWTCRIQVMGDNIPAPDDRLPKCLLNATLRS